MRALFPAYRRYSEARVAANDALMALLIGARLGGHALNASPAAPTARLPDLFGQIDGIERVNRTTSEAAQLLADAERHLASMGIPFILAVHGAYLCDAIEMLRDDGLDDPKASWTVPWVRDSRLIPLDQAHEYVMERCRDTLNIDLLKLFHLSRRIRNRILHSGGTAGSRLCAEYRALPPNVKASWTKLARRPLSSTADGKLDLADGELIAVLAVTKQLALAVNAMLVRTLSRDYWALVAARDFRSASPQRSGEAATRLRRIRTYARLYYAALGLTEAELQAALQKV